MIAGYLGGYLTSFAESNKAVNALAISSELNTKPAFDSLTLNCSMRPPIKIGAILASSVPANKVLDTKMSSFK